MEPHSYHIYTVNYHEYKFSDVKLYWFSNFLYLFKFLYPFCKTSKMYRNLWNLINLWRNRYSIYHEGAFVSKYSVQNILIQFGTLPWMLDVHIPEIPADHDMYTRNVTTFRLIILKKFPVLNVIWLTIKEDTLKNAIIWCRLCRLSHPETMEPFCRYTVILHLRSIN